MKSLFLTYLVVGILKKGKFGRPALLKLLNGLVEAAILGGREEDCGRLLLGLFGVGMIGPPAKFRKFSDGLCEVVIIGVCGVGGCGLKGC